MNGLSLQITAPRPGETIAAADGAVNVAVQVTLRCGCPTASGGRWDPGRFRVKAELSLRERLVGEASLLHTGNPSEFAGSVAVSEPGLYALDIKALDPESGLAGRCRGAFRVR